MGASIGLHQRDARVYCMDSYCTEVMCVREAKMEDLSLSCGRRVSVAGKSRPCLFCYFPPQCYIEKRHYSFVTPRWRPSEKWIISRPASASGDGDVQLF